MSDWDKQREAYDYLKEREVYLKGLNTRDLLDLLDTTIRHSHYCPCECHCFDKQPYKDFSIEELKDIIENRAY